MNRLFTIAFVLSLASSGSFPCLRNTAWFAQTRATDPTSPTQVLKEFWAVETGGGTLTPQGWEKAAAFFLKPTAAPSSYTIVVIYGDFSVWPASIEGDNAQVMIGIEEVGEIDGGLRYSPPRIHAVKEAVAWNLVRSKKYWKLCPDGKTKEQATGSPVWRISDPSGPVVYLTLDSAVRYVAQQRDKATDLMRKRNADVTLAGLKKYQQQEANQK